MAGLRPGREAHRCLSPWDAWSPRATSPFAHVLQGLRGRHGNNGTNDEGHAAAVPATWQTPVRVLCVGKGQEGGGGMRQLLSFPHFTDGTPRPCVLAAAQGTAALAPGGAPAAMGLREMHTFWVLQIRAASRTGPAVHQAQRSAEERAGTSHTQAFISGISKTRQALIRPPHPTQGLSRKKPPGEALQWQRICCPQGGTQHQHSIRTCRSPRAAEASGLHPHQGQARTL